MADCRSIQVARQTFVFPTGVKVMGATFTGLGITMKQILLGTTPQRTACNFQQDVLLLATKQILVGSDSEAVAVAESGPRIGGKRRGAFADAALPTAVVLCTGLATDQLYGMDRRLLDPRRPLRQAAPPPHCAMDASQREAGRRAVREGLPAAAWLG